jgi:soluble lytic murein transglycosylase-like protein
MIPYYDIIMEAADKEGVPFDVAKYLIERESKFNPKAVSSKGAGGIAQLMPETAKILGVKDRFDPAEAIPAGLKYLKQGFDKYGTWGQAGGYYHSGPGNMDKVGGDITKLGPRGRDYANAFSTRFDPYSNLNGFVID